MKIIHAEDRFNKKNTILKWHQKHEILQRKERDKAWREFFKLNDYTVIGECHED